MSDLWTEASRDVEAERAREALTRAKVAVSTLWPFLSMAATESEFEHRLALASEDMAQRVEASLLEPVTASLRQDFATLHQAADPSAYMKSMISRPDLEAEKGAAGAPPAPASPPAAPAAPAAPSAPSTPSAPAPSAPSGGGNGGGDTNVPQDSSTPTANNINMIKASKESDEDDDSEDDGSGKPKWLQEKIKSEARGPEDAPSRQEAERDRQLDEEDRRAGVSPPMAPEYDLSGTQHHQGRLEFFHAGLGRWVAADEPDPGDANAGKGNPAYFVGGPEAGPNTGQTSQYPTFPVGNVGDPWNPMNAQYPMQPSPWTVPPDKGWRENPMQFTPPGSPAGRQAAHRTAQEGVQGGPGPNPNYFSGGGEGASGDPQSGFPADITLPEDEEDRASTLYGAVPPQMSKGSRRYRATQENHAPDSERNLGTEFASPQERERFEKMRNGSDPGSRDSSVVARHTARFYDADQSRIAFLRMMGEGNSGDAPGPPPTMDADGPGGTAQDPLQTGVQQATNGGAPQTTPPRQMPGGGGGMPMAATRHHAEGESMSRGTNENPYGVDDPFDAKTWDNQVNQRPRMPMEHMNFNGPQNPSARRPIDTTSSPGPQREEER